MQIFTSDVIEQKFINSDNSEFSAKTTILTQNEIEKLENPDFYSQASQNSCAVFILPIKVTDVLTDEDEVYNEELLAQLRDNLKKLDENNHFAIINPIADKQISSYDDADLFINACNHMARRIKDCESVIGLELPDQIFAQEAAADFMDTLSKKHANYVFFANNSNESKVKQLADTEEYAIMTY
jgi:ribonucleotide monophosphatase NagD (HAD superfamily)